MRPTPLRRRIAYGVLSTGVLAGVLAPLTASAASACPTYVDPAKDSAPGNAALAPVLQDDGLDILSITHSTSKGVFSSTVRVAKLLETGSDYSVGDWFEMNFTVAEKAVSMRAIRDANVEDTTETRVTIDGAVQPFAPVAVYDFTASTVRLDLKVADLEKAFGTKLAGKAFSAMTARALANYIVPGVTWDTAAGTEKSSYVFGDSCGPVSAPPAGGPAASPAPTASATPGPTATPGGSAAPTPSGSATPTGSGTPQPSGSASATPSPSPTGPPEPAVPVPAEGCLGFEDEVGDSNAAAGPAGFGNDPDVDLVSVTGNTTATTLSGHLGVAQLGKAPSKPGFSGHRFEYQFTLGGKTVVLRADATGPGSGTVDGTAQSDLGVTAVFDIPSSQVVLNVDRAGLAKVLGTPVPAGTVLTEVTARSFARTAATSTVADTATAEDPARARYTVGDNDCFAPALSVTVPLQVQTSDLALVNVAVTTSDGRVAREQKLIARIGDGRAVSATTDGSGAASLFVPVLDAAGSRSLTIRSTGSAGDGRYQTPVRVLIERTVLMVRSTGSGPTRTLTATLTDDDRPRRPLAGQRLVFSFAGRTTAVTTDRAGTASAQVPADTFVDVTYAGRSGFLAPSRFRISS